MIKNCDKYLLLKYDMSCSICDISISPHPIKMIFAKSERCFRCRSKYHFFNWQYNCQRCGQSYCRKCCFYQPTSDPKKKMTLCQTCIDHRYHGTSNWCKLYDKCLEKEGKIPINWEYECKHGVKMVINLGQSCMGHWDRDCC